MGALNTFNRALIMLIGLALAAAAVICLLVVTNAVETGTLAPSGWFREQFRHLDGLTGTDETLATLACAIGITVGAMLFALELLPGERRVRTLAIRDANGNRIAMSPESLSMVAEQAVMEVEGVLSSGTTVRQADDGAQVHCEVVLQPDVNVAQKSNELNDRIRNAIQERVGIRVAGLDMNLRLSRPLETMQTRGSGWGPFRGHPGEPSPH